MELVSTFIEYVMVAADEGTKPERSQAPTTALQWRSENRFVGRILETPGQSIGRKCDRRVGGIFELNVYVCGLPRRQTGHARHVDKGRSEEHTSELQSP